MNTASYFAFTKVSDQVSFSFAVPHSTAPFAKTSHFGRVGGADHRLTFALRRTVPVTADRSQVHREMIFDVDERTFRVLMTDAAFATDTHIKLEKPVFFFGDHVGDGGHSMYDGNYRWLRQIGERRYFLPAMERMLPLSCLLYTSPSPRDS